MSRTWGEAAWTARDITSYIVTDAVGGIYGEFATEQEAQDERARLNEMGAECWVLEISAGTLEQG